MRWNDDPSVLDHGGERSSAAGGDDRTGRSRHQSGNRESGCAERRERLAGVPESSVELPIRRVPSEGEGTGPVSVGRRNPFMHGARRAADDRHAVLHSDGSRGVRATEVQARRAIVRKALIELPVRQVTSEGEIVAGRPGSDDAPVRLHFDRRGACVAPDRRHCPAAVAKRLSLLWTGGAGAHDGHGRQRNTHPG